MDEVGIVCIKCMYTLPNNLRKFVLFSEMGPRPVSSQRRFTKIILDSIHTYTIPKSSTGLNIAQPSKYTQFHK